MLTVLKVQDSSPMEGLDHLFLLPERALAMGSARLQKDLAGLNFDGHMLHEAPMGNVWICKFNFMLKNVRLKYITLIILTFDIPTRCL